MGSATNFGIKVIRNYTNYEQCSCPYHVDHSPSAVYLKHEDVFYCYSCHRRKTMSELAKDLKLTDDLFGIPMDDTKMPVFADNSVEYVESYVPIGTSFAGMKYLQERQISIELAINLEIEYSIKHEGIVFPQIMYGKRIGNVIRLINGKSNARYIIDGKIEPLWNMREYKILNDYLFISEGAFKAMSIKMAADVLGIRNFISLCTFGARMNTGTEEVIDQFKGKIIMVGDNDRAGVTFGEKMKNKGIKVIIPKIPFDNMTNEQRVATLEKILERVNNEQF